ncbi:hypothetical protein ABHI18_011612, partial [Aspergillus niger]
PLGIARLVTRGAESRNNEAAQRHLGKTKTQESGNPGIREPMVGKRADHPTGLLYRSGSRHELEDNDQ